MPPTVIRRTRRHSRTMAFPPPQASLYSMTVDTKQQQAPHPSFPFLTPPPNPSWSTAATAVNVSLTIDAQQQQQLSLQSSQAPLQKQCPSASPSLHLSSPTESEMQGKKIHAMKVVQEGKDKGPGTPPRQPLCEKNTSPDSSFLNALQENNELESGLISLSSVQKPMEEVLESRSQKENCSPLKGLRNCPPRSNLSTKQNQALKKRALSTPGCTVSPKKVKALPVSAATSKEAHQCSPVPLVVASKDCPCSSLCTEDQNKDLFSAPCPTEDPRMEACSKLGSDLVSTLIASPVTRSTNSAWILPETTHRDLPSIHGSSADLDPTSCLSICESALDKDLGVSTFDLIESGDSQGCRENQQMSEPLISIDDILEWDGCCFSDLMSGMLSDSMQGSFSRAEDDLPDPCNSSRSSSLCPHFCLKKAIVFLILILCGSFLSDIVLSFQHGISVYSSLFPLCIYWSANLFFFVSYTNSYYWKLTTFLDCAEVSQHQTGLNTTVWWMPSIMKVTYPSFQVQLTTRTHIQVKC